MSRSGRAGIREVASRAGVGIATVSRVYTGNAEVNPELRARVMEAARELGYAPDITAQSLRRGATMSAGFIADDLGLHLNTDIATGAEGVLRGRDYSLLVMNSEMDPQLDITNIGVLRARNVDALMMTPVTEDDPGLVAALASVDVPIVIVEGDLPGIDRVDFVVSDHRAGVGDALRHLVELGHRRLAVIHGPCSLRSARQRAAAVDDVAAEVMGDLRLEAIETELSPDGGRRSTQALLERDEPPTAIVVGGDQLLTGALGAIRATGARMGREVSVVTTDPVPLAELFMPPLASITRDAVGLGRTAAEIMLRSGRDRGSGPEVVLLPTTFTPRASIGPPTD